MVEPRAKCIQTDLVVSGCGVTGRQEANRVARLWARGEPKVHCDAQANISPQLWNRLLIDAGLCAR